MAERYSRAQLLLRPEQHDRLREIAEREDRSISDVAREMVERGLSAREKDRRSRFQQAREALDQLDQIRQQVLAQHGVYHGDLIAETRSERENALDEIRRGKTQ